MPAQIRVKWAHKKPQGDAPAALIYSPTGKTAEQAGFPSKFIVTR